MSSRPIRRGDVWTIDLGDPIGHEQGYRRPAVVLSADRLNQSRAGVVIVVPLTRSRRMLPSHVEIAPGESGLRETSYAKVEDLRSLSVQRLERRCGTVDDRAMAALAAAARILLAL